jgi:hypothetical protein
MLIKTQSRVGFPTCFDGGLDLGNQMNLSCHHCKSSVTIPAVSGRSVVAFRETCPSCGNDLHICLNCALYDSGSYHECRESSAEWVKDKERSNRCEYFSPNDKTRQEGGSKAAAKSALDDLFK